MTVAARELDLSRLDRDARGWANERFAYTHGYGVAGIGAAAVDAEQFPYFEQREFVSASNPLSVRQPRIYFGERRYADPPYLIAPSNRGEVEQPIPGSRAATYHYDGPVAYRSRRDFGALRSPFASAISSCCCPRR